MSDHGTIIIHGTGTLHHEVREAILAAQQQGVEVIYMHQSPPCSTYIPVMDRGYPDTAQTEMARLLEECAKLGRENTTLRKALEEIRDFQVFFTTHQHQAHEQRNIARTALLMNRVDHILSNASAVAPATLDAALPKDVMAG